MTSMPRCPGHCSISLSISTIAEVQATSASEQIELKNEQLLHTEENKKDATPAPEQHEEARRPRVGRRPVLPTKAEIDESYTLHLNYRDWCEHCVSGKPRLAQHKVEPADRERLGVTFSADYAFMGSEEADEGMQPTLVMYDNDKMAFWAPGVAKKEVNE